jgi:poly(hydroxyalkanoate) depolymerase family esterase
MWLFDSRPLRRAAHLQIAELNTPEKHPRFINQSQALLVGPSRLLARAMPKTTQSPIGDLRANSKGELRSPEPGRLPPALSQPLSSPPRVRLRLAQTPTRLQEVMGFGLNPGRLRMYAYVPDPLSRSPALVVVLHGCLQSAAEYDLGAGWSTLADRFRFALLFPEQQRTNNPRGCFNWFQRGDSERHQGEALSIRHMVEYMIQAHAIDRSRVFITGLSAGGAMTSVMLAAYPEVFAGGAVIAGVPYRSAIGVLAALRCMLQGQVRSAREWGDLVRAASRHPGPWPKLSVWHGSADLTVSPVNAAEIVKQWADVHGLAAIPSREEIVDGYSRRVWTNAAGEDVLEQYSISGMGHGTPVAVRSGPERHGAAGPFLLDAGIPSSYHIARFWGLSRVEQTASALAGIDAEPTPHSGSSVGRTKWLGRLRASAARALGAVGLME